MSKTAGGGVLALVAVFQVVGWVYAARGLFSIYAGK